MLRSLHWLAVDELERGNGDDGPAEAPAGYLGCGPEDVYLIQYLRGVPKPVTVTAGSAAHNVRAGRKAYDHDCGLPASCSSSPSPPAPRERWRPPTPSSSGWSSRSAHGRRKVLELGSLRNLILINEPIYKSVVDEFVQAFSRDGLRATSVSPSYGLAENCTFVSTAWRSGCSDDDFPSYKKLLPSPRLSPPPPSLVSRQWPELGIVVVDEETGEPVEDGVEGGDMGVLAK